MNLLETKNTFAKIIFTIEMPIFNYTVKVLTEDPSIIESGLVKIIASIIYTPIVLPVLS